MRNSVEILGVKINLYSEREILEKIEKYVKQRTKNREQKTKKCLKPLVIFTPNPEIVMYAQRDANFKRIVNSSQINIPDGQGIVWAANLMGYPIKRRITGADLMEKIIYLVEKRRIVIGLIGGFNGLALKAFECLKVKYPKLKGWAEEGPEIRIKNYELRIMNKERLFSSTVQLDYGGWDINKFLKRVRKRQTRILFVGFGCPKQEYFINKISQRLDNIVLMAVGGTFSYVAGRITRAPKWVQTIGLEWLWRLIKEPYRIKRQTVLPKFVIKILQAKILK